MPRLACAILVLFASTAASPSAATDEEANKALVLAMIEAVNARDLDALDAIVAADVVRHSAATTGVAVRSLADFKTFLEGDFAAVPDSTITVEHLLAEDDLVAVHAVYAGTQRGPMGPFPASGKRVEGPFLSVLRVEDGKIAEMWVEWDNLDMLRQLGHLPDMAATAGTNAPDTDAREELLALNREVLERLLVHADPAKLDEVALEEFLVIAPGFC